MDFVGGGGEERRAFWAKVSTRGSFVVGFWADDVVLANGFAAALLDPDAAKGLACAGEGDLTPNNVSPRFTGAAFVLSLLDDAPPVVGCCCCLADGA